MRYLPGRFTHSGPLWALPKKFTFLCCFFRIFLFFKAYTKGNVFFRFLKAKNEEKLKTIVFLWHGKNQFAQFWGSPHKNFLIDDCTLKYCKRMVFQRKIVIFKVHVNFRTWIFCRARARSQISRFFGIEFTKVYLIGRRVPVFENHKKVTLLEKFWRISLHVTDEAIAKLYLS